MYKMVFRDKLLFQCDLTRKCFKYVPKHSTVNFTVYNLGLQKQD